MEIEKKQYILSQQFACHTQGVRCVDVAKDLLICGSTDKTVKVFQAVDGKYEMICDINFFDDFIQSVKINLFGEGFFVGCKDKNIYQLDATGSPTNTFTGHEGPVCSLSQIDEKRIVSGSWDGTARVWDIQSASQLLKLEGHSHAVTVLGVSSLDLIVTGSQDKNLNFWNLTSGKRTKQVKDAHQDIIRQISFVEDIGFLSASNDETLKLWTFDGELVSLLQGHSAFVFACAAISFGEYISGSDDHTIKIWNSTQVVQSILHSATVWAVAVNPLNQDIISACADGSLRIFTTDQNRKAAQIEIEDFEKNASLASAKGPQGLPPDELAKLPEVSRLTEFRGKKDGELKIFRNGDVPEAYAWKEAESKWDKIGEVLSTVNKKTYPGDQFFPAGDYDYIFDVEDDSGFAKSIPFNEGDNPMEVAEKYCARESISRGNVEQIRQFLQKNTKSGGSFSSQTASQSSSQQFQQYNQPQQKTSNFFPMSQFQLFEARNLEGLKKKLLEFNENLKAENDPNQLQEKHVLFLNNIISLLEKTNQYHSSRLTPNELEVITLKLASWPRQYLLPFFDLLRMFALHPQSDSLFSGVDSGLKYITLMCGTLMAEDSSDPLRALVLRLLCNLFQQTQAKYSFYKYYKFFQDSFIKLSSSSSAPIKTALATLLFNLSAEIVDNPNHSVESTEAYLRQIISNLMIEKDADNILKYLIAMGNYALKLPKIGKPLIKIALREYQPNINDARINECYNDLLNIV